MNAEVLNGTVGEGDTIAYATRQGSHMAMNVATVRKVIESGVHWRGHTLYKLNVQVNQTSGYAAVPRIVTIGELDRVVKLSQPQAQVQQELSCTSATTQLSGTPFSRRAGSNVKAERPFGFTS